ncbi:enolase C-terminal domain-like protein [Roseomonas sp. BN140053]|uniref:enolase C-terminal domain-like protein n=1 Tax=Roseomonas sp. BN140053 TaxID=3391898 RepID=UPI0039E9D1D9
MRIASIDAWRCVLPRRDHAAAARRPSYLGSAPHAFPLARYPEFPRLVHQVPGALHPEIWVRVTAEDGSWGIGQSHWGNLVAPIVAQHFALLLVGRDCFATELHNDLMWRYAQRFGAGGLAAAAQSAVDQALWDLKGKLLEQPVYRLLGGPCRDAVELYATTDDLDWAVELGFRAFKISNPVHYDDGLAGLNRLEEKVAAAREAVGPDAELMLNPNMSFNVEFALRAMERLHPYRLRWFEEPLPPHDLEGYAQLKRACPTLPIAAGEDHRGRHAFRQLVEHRGVDVLQPDLRWCGGLTEGLKIYAIAEAAGLATVPHAGGSTPAGLHFAFAMPESTVAEYWLPSAPGVPLAQANPFPGLPAPVNGRIAPTDAPGFGLEFLPEHFVPWS